MLAGCLLSWYGVVSQTSQVSPLSPPDQNDENESALLTVSIIQMTNSAKAVSLPHRDCVIPRWAPEWVGYRPTFKEPTVQEKDNTDDDKMNVLRSKSAWLP